MGGSGRGAGSLVHSECSSAALLLELWWGSTGSELRVDGSDADAAWHTVDVKFRQILSGLAGEKYWATTIPRRRAHGWQKEYGCFSCGTFNTKLKAI
jgi:hypothetical protein